MSRGLSNFVLSDDTSMDEAMAAARNETDREQTSQQLDAFHKTFNFCMSCRQYTCGNCWNEAEGRCLSCAPELGQEVMPAPFPDARHRRRPEPHRSGAERRPGSERLRLASAPAEPLAWPTSDLMREAEAEPVDGAFDAAIAAAAEDAANGADLAEAAESAPFDDETLPEDESFDFAARFAAVTAATEAVAAEPPAAEAPTAAPAKPPVEPVVVEPVVVERAVEPDVAAATETAATDDVLDHPAAAAAAAAAANTTDLFQRFRPGQSLDDEIEAFEREQAAEAAARLLPPLPPRRRSPSLSRWRQHPWRRSRRSTHPSRSTAEPEAAPVETFEPEPVAVEPETEPAWPEPAWPEPAAAEGPVDEPLPVPAGDPRVDYVPQPTWQIVAPDGPATNGAPAPPSQLPTQPSADAIAASAEPQWPDRARPPAFRSWADPRPRAADRRVVGGLGPAGLERQRGAAGGCFRHEGGRRPAVRQLRPVAVRERSVLPPLRHSPGLTSPSRRGRGRRAHVPRRRRTATPGMRTTATRAR